MGQVKIVSDPAEYFDLLSSDKINVTNVNFINDELIEVHCYVLILLNKQSIYLSITSSTSTSLLRQMERQTLSSRHLPLHMRVSSYTASWNSWIAEFCISIRTRWYTYPEVIYVSRWYTYPRGRTSVTLLMNWMAHTLQHLRQVVQRTIVMKQAREKLSVRCEE